MKNRHMLLGLGLIVVGLFSLLKNFNIVSWDAIILLFGFFLLYNYHKSRRQGFLVFGSILTFFGVLNLLDNLSFYRHNMSGSIFFILLGAVFLYLYFTKHISGFLIPGCLLPAVGIYMVITNMMGDRYMWPSIYVLLGLGFYCVYFIGYMDKGNWPLTIGTVLIALGILMFAVSLGFLVIDVVRYSGLLWPAVLILIGGWVLYRSRGQKNKE